MKAKTTSTIPDNFIEALRLPEILGERCVHGLMENASCRACVDSCPREAWILDDEQLGIAAAACDNCGLCAAVCPEGAILHHHEPLTGEWKNHPLALCACERQSGLGDSRQGIVPCIHSLGISNLLTLYHKGFRLIYLSTASCDDCDRGQGERLESRIKQINGMLEQRGLADIRTKFVSEIQWRRIADKITETQSGRQVSRRNFLRKVLADTAEKTLQAVNLLESERLAFTPPAACLPAARESDSLPYVPQIDAQKCAACNACIQLCPHNALLAEFDADSPAYRLDAKHCSGCMICTDVCENDAISVSKWMPARQHEVPLTAVHCRDCGVPFHSTHTETPDQCTICASTRHTTNLFQVLD